VLSAIDERRKAGEPVHQAIVDGALERLRPVLMTAMLAALGLIPAAMSHGIGSETQKPIAVVIVAGTVTACLLTLVLLPVLYQWLDRVQNKLAKDRVTTSNPGTSAAPFSG
jgi:cobalt-zinc-cadmium resistance protein CzcA